MTSPLDRVACWFVFPLFWLICLAWGIRDKVVNALRARRFQPEGWRRR